MGKSKAMYARSIRVTRQVPCNSRRARALNARESGHALDQTASSAEHEPGWSILLRVQREHTSGSEQVLCGRDRMTLRCEKRDRARFSIRSTAFCSADTPMTAARTRCACNASSRLYTVVGRERRMKRWKSSSTKITLLPALQTQVHRRLHSKSGCAMLDAAQSTMSNLSRLRGRRLEPRLLQAEPHAATVLHARHELAWSSV